MFAKQLLSRGADQGFRSVSRIVDPIASLVIEKDGLDVLVQFTGEKDATGVPHRLWYRRTNVITIDGVTEIP